MTTSPDVQRVLNRRICDKKHKHGRLFDLSSESSLQFPKSLCQTLAKTVPRERQLAFSFGVFWNICILMTMSDHSILLLPITKYRWKLIVKLMCHRQLCPHLHFHRKRHLLMSDIYRERQLAFSFGVFWKMCIQMKMSDHSILLPPVTKHRWKLIVKRMCHRQLDAGPNSPERKVITNWLQKIHQQIGHRDNRTLVRLLKQRGTHPWFLKMATEHRCSACEESSPPALRHITSSCENVLGAILEIDGMRWQHPVTGRHARCQFMVDVGSRAPMITVS